MLRSWSITLLPFLAGVIYAFPANISEIKRSTQSPSIPRDFPDPSIIYTQGSWWSFATSSSGINVQIAQSQDFNGWNVMGKDALPNLPSWVNGPDPEVWAPDVSQRDDGSFVMYFSAALAQFPTHHCIGAAFSGNIDGPYSPQDTPLICPDPSGSGLQPNSLVSSPGSGGAIDASGFRDADGSRYIIYKIDGNSLGPGGPCGNGGANIVPTPIMILPVQGDGVTPRGGVQTILQRDDNDGPLVEAPSVARLADGTYALFFSSNCWNTDFYDVTWATAPSVMGPYTKFGPMFTTGVQGLKRPGGASIAADGQHVVFHADFGSGRAMYTTTITGVGAAIQYAA